MQSFLEVMLPAILASIFGITGIVIGLVVGLARMRLWSAQREKISANIRHIEEIHGERGVALQTAQDAITSMIAEMSSYPSTYSTMSSEVSKALYEAHRLLSALSKGAQ
jgi:hypothetical protein